MTKRYSLKIADRTADLIIAEDQTDHEVARVSLDVDGIEKLETLLAVAKQVLTGNVRKESE